MKVEGTNLILTIKFRDQNSYFAFVLFLSSLPSLELFSFHYVFFDCRMGSLRSIFRHVFFSIFSKLLAFFGKKRSKKFKTKIREIENFSTKNLKRYKKIPRFFG